jgi:hypothetical protein
MKQIVILLLSVLCFASCRVRVTAGPNGTVVKEKSLPPGLAKKITGEKSAKNHAPGHNK